jgi:hypothetical protein
VNHSLKWLRLSVLPALSLLAGGRQILAQQLHLEPHVAGLELQDMHGRNRSFAGGDRVTVLLFFSTRCPLSNAFNYRRNVLYHDFRKEVYSCSSIRMLTNPWPKYVNTRGELGSICPRIGILKGELRTALAHVRPPIPSFSIKLVPSATTATSKNAPNPDRATQRGLRTALVSVLAGRSVTTPETRAIGCAVRHSHPAAD